MTNAGLASSPVPTPWSTVPTRMLEAGGIRFAHRELGPRCGVPVVFLTHLAAVLGWGNEAPQDLSKIAVPTRVANGESDRMVPTSNTLDLGRRLPNSEVVVYPDAGHGGVFQCHDLFVPKMLTFLADPHDAESDKP